MWPIILSDRLRIFGLVEPLPHQLPNPTRAHLPPAIGLFLVYGIRGNTPLPPWWEVDSHALLTRSPLCRCRSSAPFDLHVSGLPLAFILSQDQTLVLLLPCLCMCTGRRMCLSSLSCCRVSILVLCRFAKVIAFNLVYCLIRKQLVPAYVKRGSQGGIVVTINVGSDSA